MRMLTLLVFGIGACVAAFSPEATEADKLDMHRLEGTWKMVSGEEDGHEIPAEVVAVASLTFVGDHHVVHVGDMITEGVTKIDASAKPKTIDGTDTAGPFKGRTLLGIYELTDHEFTVCFAAHGHERPKDFTAKAGSGAFVHRWKRQ